MHSMRSVQHQVELKRLGNQLPVLGKANSLCKIVKMLGVLPTRPRPSVGRVFFDLIYLEHIMFTG